MKKGYKKYKPYHFKNDKAFMINLILDFFAWIRKKF